MVELELEFEPVFLETTLFTHFYYINDYWFIITTNFMQEIVSAYGRRRDVFLERWSESLWRKYLYRDLKGERKPDIQRARGKMSHAKEKG